MPNGSVRPNCKGNYKNGPKAHGFSFPKDKELFKIHTIKRDNFSPTKFSRVSIFVLKWMDKYGLTHKYLKIQMPKLDI